MDNRSQPQRVREELEVARPGTADLSDPELAAAARALLNDATLRLARRRIEGWDVAIGRAVEDVEVPAGLQERLLARLAVAADSPLLATSLSAAEQLPPGIPADAVALPAAQGGLTAGGEPQPGRMRAVRYWTGVGVSAVTAAALVVAAGYWLQMGIEVELDRLADSWQAELTDDWQQMSLAPEGFPYPEAMMRVVATRWQWIDRYTPTPVVAYELSDGKTTALLYAAEMSREGLGRTPPLKPQRDTGGQAVGYWQSGKLVYVLVVNDVDRYRAFVRPANTPLAVLLPRRADPFARRSVPRLRATCKIA